MIQYNIIDLSNKIFIENNEITELLNIKLEYNYPKVVLFSNINKIISIYDNNQLAIINFKYQKDIINTNDKEYLNIKINSHSKLTPKILHYSNIYSESYNPLYLFDDSSYYYCSGDDYDKNKKEFELDFCCDYISLKK